MSFAGNTGHKSPFPERAKAARSPLPPKRSGSSPAPARPGQRGGPEAGNPRGARQSLFGKESQAGNLAKVGQWRTAQAEVSEPTTPTRMSEGGWKENLRRDGDREDFSTFSKGKVVTPVKTPKPTFGATAPRSPKRPYMSSPKYQKVVLDRPAFYSALADGEATSELPKREVSIVELQARMKKFLDEGKSGNDSIQSLEVPYTISSSPRVNPLYHHDHTLSQIAKGGVDFTAGVESESARYLDLATDDSMHEENESCGVQITPSAVKLNPQLLEGEVAPTATDSGNFEFISTYILRGESQFHSGVAPTGSEVIENAVDEPSQSEASNFKDAEVLEVQDCIVESSSSNLTEEEAEVFLSRDSTTTDGPSDVELDQGAQVRAEALETHSTTTPELREEDDGTSSEEDIQILEPWRLRFLKGVMLIFTVACLMGAVVLASGSPGLLPKGLSSNPMARAAREPSLHLPFLPISIGIMGTENGHESFPCQPAVQLSMEFFKSMFRVGTGSFEGLSHGYLTRYSPSIAGRKEIELIEKDVVDALDQLKIVTDHFKDLQGRLFSDVASLTNGSPTFDPSESNHEGTSVEVDGLANFMGNGREVITTCPLSEGDFTPGCPMVDDFINIKTELESEESLAVVDSELTEDKSKEVIIVPDRHMEVVLTAEGVSFDNMDEYKSSAMAEAVVSIPIAQFPSSASEGLALDMAAQVGDLSSQTKGSVLNDEVPTLEEVPQIMWSIEDHPQEAREFSNDAQVKDLLQLVDELFDTVGEDSQGHDVGKDRSPETQLQKWVTEPPVYHRAADVAELLTSDQQKDSSFPSVGFPPAAAIGILVAALGVALPFLLQRIQKTLNFAEASIVLPVEEAAPLSEPASFPVTETLYTPSISPAAWPSTHYVHDTYIPDKQELDAISSPLSKLGTPGKYGVQSYSTRFRKPEPASSAPAAQFKRNTKVEEKSTMSAQTWHYPTPMQGVQSTTSSSYRLTASYVPSHSGMSTNGSPSETNSVAESALSMGSEECDQLGSFTTKQFVSANEGGSEQKKLTPVRRSQRIRNKAVSPLPPQFAF